VPCVCLALAASIVNATMALSELFASFTQPTPATPIHTLRFSLMLQRALTFPLTQTEAPTPVTPPMTPAAAGGSAVGAAVDTADKLAPAAVKAPAKTSCCGCVSDMCSLLFYKT